jgi:hypothetical protein
MYNIRLWSVLVLLVCVSVYPSMAKEVVGWVEHVRVYPGNVLVNAKVDTGARTSSLDCECIDPLTVNGRQWVSFSVKDKTGMIVSIKKPVVRIAKIRRHFGEEQRRYVVKLGICLGGIYREEEVTLVDRSGFNYPMLVGRNFLKRDFLVDPVKTYISDPDCKDVPGQ